ncbi:MAG TPA: tripartite tricarboxylate transporter substrate-binding protein [Xanthobacteraceae bacterium]|nr:tripartite tricarboxylate transporter substrate-binding protein [Xanthobacteraceae bacterium]
MGWRRIGAASVVAGAALAAIVATGPAHAQGDYPNKPVRIIVDSAPGSATDVALRVVAERLGRIWNQQVVALNNPGAGGSIATRAASQSPNDGYTLYFPAASTFTALAGAPGVPANLPIQVPRDFLPIGFVTQLPMFIAASPKSGINSIADLIAAAKKEPGGISYATTGVGRITHLTMELLQIRAGIKLQMIPYAGGPTQALSDLIAGRVQIVLDGYAGVGPGIEGGSTKGIAVATAKRLPEFPNLPTVAETLPGFFAGGWNVLVAPLGTPDPIIRKVAADLRVALEDKGVQAKLATVGTYVQPMTPEELTAFIQEQQKVWKPVAEAVAAAQKK